MIEHELSGIRDQVFHKQGANAIEAERIKERLDAGDTAEQISSDMMIVLSTVESFKLETGKERELRPLWVGDAKGTRDDRPFYAHKGRPLRDPRTVAEGGVLSSEELRVDASGKVSSPKLEVAQKKAETARVAKVARDEEQRIKDATAVAKASKKKGK